MLSGGMRGGGVIWRPRGEGGIQKLPIEAFHENYKSSLLFILILEDGCVIPFLCISFFFLFFFFEKIGKNGIE